jgi:predicted anti-sigma-YlaC factor YlaD
MNCKQCTENLTAFLDGELLASESSQVQHHLDSCASCADELRSLKEAADFIESHCRNLQPLPGSWNLVRAHLSATDSPSRFRLFAAKRLRFALASLVILFALGVGHLYQRSQRRDLENYITQYIQDREARSQSIAQSQSDLPYAGNPFIEKRVDFIANPFSLEE